MLMGNRLSLRYRLREAVLSVLTELLQAVVLLALMWVFIARGDDATQPDFESLAHSAQGRAAEYAGKLPKIQVAPNGDDVKALADYGRQRGRAEFEALKNADEAPRNAAMPAGTINPAPAPNAPTQSVPGLVVLAVSSSMPLQMLRDYMAQLDGRPGVIVVIRGFIGGAHQAGPTGQWIEQVLRSEPDCLKCAHRAVRVVIDPLVFESLRIQQVPAVAYLPGVSELKHCEKEVYSAASVAFGGSSIEGALRAIQKSGATVPDSVVSAFKGHS